MDIRRKRSGTEKKVRGQELGPGGGRTTRCPAAPQVFTHHRLLGWCRMSGCGRRPLSCHLRGGSHISNTDAAAPGLAVWFLGSRKGQPRDWSLNVQASLGVLPVLIRQGRIEKTVGGKLSWGRFELGGMS